MSRIRRSLIAAVVGAGVILLGFAVLRPASGGSAGAVGQSAPLFSSIDLSGRPVLLSSYRGRRVILNFWASWCIPCRSEFPVLKQLQVEHPDVVVLGVVFEDTAASARSFMASQGAGWPAVQDPKSQIADAYGVHAKPGIPVSVLVDPSGQIRARRYGALGNQAAADAFIAQSPAT
jgi:cytochrome c biogenesis protein CcmG, thiol:disulfide interchange protein DsbE